MKIKKIILLALGLCLSFYTYAQSINVGTYNLRYANPRDTGNMWENRAPIVASLIRFHNFDVFGTQEGLLNQLEDISKVLPQYERYGVGRDDGKDAGEHSAIFFKKERFKLLDKGDFWLSETPDKPSLGWDATCCNRICSWVYLQDKQSKKEFYFFNAHYDHQGKIAREESSKLILEKIKAIAGKKPTILTGDFNGSHSSSWYQRVANSGTLIDTYTRAKNPYANNASFNSFKRNVPGNDIIDHIFTTGNFEVIRWGILTDSYHGKYPSDHFPVLAEISF